MFQAFPYLFGLGTWMFRLFAWMFDLQAGKDDRPARRPGKGDYPAADGGKTLAAVKDQFHEVAHFRHGSFRTSHLLGMGCAFRSNLTKHRQGTGCWPGLSWFWLPAACLCPVLSHRLLSWRTCRSAGFKLPGFASSWPSGATDARNWAVARFGLGEKRIAFRAGCSRIRP